MVCTCRFYIFAYESRYLASLASMESWHHYLRFRGRYTFSTSKVDCDISILYEVNVSIAEISGTKSDVLNMEIVYTDFHD